MTGRLPRRPASLFSVVLDPQDFLNGSSVWDNAEIGNLRFPINPFCLCRPDSTIPLLHVEIVNSLSLATGRCVQSLLYEFRFLYFDQLPLDLRRVKRTPSFVWPIRLTLLSIQP